MSKNLTLKGLALGAVVALGTTLFAGAPAQAASVLFAPTTGTGNTLVAGESFSLTASLSADLPASNASQLKFIVVNTTGVKTPSIKINNTSLTASNAVTYSSTGASTDAGDVWATTAPAAGTSKVFALGNGSGVSAETNPTSIQIASTKDTTDSYAVTAFLDANNNGVLDAGELSAVQTVNFVKVANAGVSVAFPAPTTSATSLSATVSFGPDVNIAQLTASNYHIGFGKYLTTGEIRANGSVSTDVLDAAHTVALSKNTAVTALVPTSTYSAAITASTYGAQVWSSATDGSTFVAIGSEVLAAAGAAQADVNTSALAPATSDNTATTGTAGTFNVRTGTTATSLKMTVKNTVSSVTSAVGAGVPVNYTVTAFSAPQNATTLVTDTIKVNGVALTSAALPVTGTVLTDASGVATISVETTSGNKNDSVTVSAVPANSTLTASQAILNWADATTVAPIDLAVGSNTHAVVKGGTFTASYALTDSYHALVTSSAYRIRFTEPGAGASTTSNTVYVPFVNGIANVSVADNSTAAGVNNATVTVEKNVNGLWVSGADLTGLSANDSALASAVSASFTVLASAQVATAVTVPADTTASIDTADTFATVNQETAYNSTIPGVVASGVATPAIVRTISGVVTDANGVGVNSASVTIAAAGVQFVSGASAPRVYSVGSITVTTDALGNYTVDVYSHVAGATKFVVTSGAATKTSTITYTAVSGYSTAASMTVAGPTTSQAARAATFTATVVDKLGNVVGGVALKATLTGVGSFAGSTSADGSLAVTTSSTGVATVTVLFGANDLGDTVVTFADATGQTTPIASVAKTVSVGATDANIDIVNNRVTAVTSFSKGKTVSFYVDGFKKWSKLSASDADVVLYYNLKKGTHTVTVKISGGFVTTEKFIVK